MSNQILALKKLNAAYIAALEYDRCPDEEEAGNLAENFLTGVSEENLKKALSENSGRRPDEIASSMSEIIKLL